MIRSEKIRSDVIFFFFIIYSHSVVYVYIYIITYTTYIGRYKTFTGHDTMQINR
jgi:hypothetical protein